MRLPWLVLVASILVSPATAQDPAGIPCRNLFSEEQCAEREKRREAEERKAKVRAMREGTVELRGAPGTTFVEKITVEANPEDIPMQEKDRWQRFEEAVTAKPVVSEFVGNDGVRMICVSPCTINCCKRVREFTTTGRNAGQ